MASRTVTFLKPLLDKCLIDQRAIRIFQKNVVAPDWVTRKAATHLTMRKHINADQKLQWNSQKLPHWSTICTYQQNETWRDQWAFNFAWNVMNSRKSPYIPQKDIISKNESTKGMCKECETKRTRYKNNRASIDLNSFQWRKSSHHASTQHRSPIKAPATEGIFVMYWLHEYNQWKKSYYMRSKEVSGIYLLQDRNM